MWDKYNTIYIAYRQAWCESSMKLTIIPVVVSKCMHARTTNQPTTYSDWRRLRRRPVAGPGRGRGIARPACMDACSRSCVNNDMILGCLACNVGRAYNLQVACVTNGLGCAACFASTTSSCAVVPHSLLMVRAQLFRGQSDNRDACAAADWDDGYGSHGS
jgi:hypothetical protein